MCIETTKQIDNLVEAPVLLTLDISVYGDKSYRFLLQDRDAGQDSKLR